MESNNKTDVSQSATPKRLRKVQMNRDSLMKRVTRQPDATSPTIELGENLSFEESEVIYVPHSNDENRSEEGPCCSKSLRPLSSVVKVRRLPSDINIDVLQSTSDHETHKKKEIDIEAPNYSTNFGDSPTKSVTRQPDATSPTIELGENLSFEEESEAIYIPHSNDDNRSEESPCCSKSLRPLSSVVKIRIRPESQAHRSKPKEISDIKGSYDTRSGRHSSKRKTDKINNQTGQPRKFRKTGKYWSPVRRTETKKRRSNSPGRNRDTKVAKFTQKSSRHRYFPSTSERRNRNEDSERAEITPKNEDLIALERVLREQRSKHRTSGQPIKRARPRASTPAPANFREMSIFPQMRDIRGCDDLRLRRNDVGKHYESCDEYLDLHFRLLREDFIGPLRDGLWNKSSEENKRSYTTRNYGSVTLESSHNIKDTEMWVKFRQPSRKVDWENSKRLGQGNILCFSNHNFKDRVIFGTVSRRNTNFLKDGRVLVDFSQDSSNTDIKRTSAFSNMLEYTTLFEAYRPVLKALQETHTIPLERYIIHAECNVRRAMYLPEFREYNLSPLIPKDLFPEAGDKWTNVDLFDEQSWPSADELHLSEVQRSALKHALTRELAIIQGPPGTGKTHVGLLIMRALLANRPKENAFSSNASRILVVCYTNHALDQFLEGISKFQQSGIVRVGGRSSNPALEKYSLEKISRERKIPAVNHAFREMKIAKSALDGTIEELKNPKELSTKIIPTRMLEQFREESLFSTVPVEHGFLEWLGIKFTPWEREILSGNVENPTRKEIYILMWKRHKLMSKVMRSTPMRKEDAERIVDVYQTSQRQRLELYRYWKKFSRPNLIENIQKEKLQKEDCEAKFQAVKALTNQNILRSASVIGMTTTGAAKHRELLQDLPIKTMIVEEAAEVLEAHIVTSLPPSLEHLILIGDHQQLKPSPAVYKLAKKFNLEMSLFERLIRNECPYVKLDVQHRMQSRIADLLRLNIYKDLRDHPSVVEPVNIRGVKSNIFFVSHNHAEEARSDDASKANSHEAEFLEGLCRYLLIQGYKPGQITVLVTYKEQMFVLRRLLQEKSGNTDEANYDTSDILVTPVDNYQGEENDIILLSLVRSNVEGKIGFLNVENRICVALSRAKKALYCIGNLMLLKSKSKVWSQIVENLENDGLSGTSFPVCCRKHDVTTTVTTGKDFHKLPNGCCCDESCDARLPCGHACPRHCHEDDEWHSTARCQKPCTRKCQEGGHQCRNQCFQKCGPCREIVEKMMPDCGHIQDLPCHIPTGKHRCQALCTGKLDCGHSFRKKCGWSNPICEERVLVLLECGHQAEGYCYKAKTMTKKSCQHPCEVILNCGHPCPGNCSECFQGLLHVTCDFKCTRVNYCGHPCKDPCPSNCPPCDEKCSIFCEHSKCYKLCREPCTPCQEQCNWKCEHFSCSKLCSEPCDRPPCNEPCKKRKTKCGHPCIGLCGEPCPTLCRQCNKQEVTSIFFGDEDEEDAKFVQLMDCEHVFTYQSLDTWMSQDSDDGGQTTSIQFKECPKCKTVIRRSRRYGNIVNQQLELMEKVKLKLYESNEVLELDLSKHFNITRFQDVSLTRIKVEYFKQRKIMTKWFKKMKKDEVILLITGVEKNCMIANLKNLARWFNKDRKKFTPQEIQDFNQESQRIELASVYRQTEMSLSGVSSECQEEVATMLERMRKLIFDSCVPFTAERQCEVVDLQKQIKIKVPNLPGLGITDEERRSIVKAMDFGQKGHWYKCKNGHVYCITECGGAMQKSKCPECGEAIGGQSHRLEESNEMAPVMDGGTRPAYDPTNTYIPPEAFL